MIISGQLLRVYEEVNHQVLTLKQMLIPHRLHKIGLIQGGSVHLEQQIEEPRHSRVLLETLQHRADDGLDTLFALVSEEPPDHLLDHVHGQGVSVTLLNGLQLGEQKGEVRQHGQLVEESLFG